MLAPIHPPPHTVEPVPRLLRLLLCLSLMLNGIGTATANARMAAMEVNGTAGMAHPAHPSQPAEPPAAPANDGDCAHHRADTAPPAPMPHDDSDCLQSCLAMCLHNCYAVPGLSLSLILARFVQEPAQRELPERRTPPAPPPVRPPIA